MFTCSHCGKESDRLAIGLEMHLHEINLALGLDRYATQERRLEWIKKYVDAYVFQEVRAGRVEIPVDDIDPEWAFVPEPEHTQKAIMIAKPAPLPPLEFDY